MHSSTCNLQPACPSVSKQASSLKALKLTVRAVRACSCVFTGSRGLVHAVNFTGAPGTGTLQGTNTALGAETETELS